jgi:hypothetical protein
MACSDPPSAQGGLYGYLYLLPGLLPPEQKKVSNILISI